MRTGTAPCSMTHPAFARAGSGLGKKLCGHPINVASVLSASGRATQGREIDALNGPRRQPREYGHPIPVASEISSFPCRRHLTPLSERPTLPLLLAPFVAGRSLSIE